jgi:hypothetical protein
MDESSADLIQKAKAVLDLNDEGTHTIPAEGLYPHQWLWDSCFIAIGIANYDVERAQTEILSLLEGQWSNGMIPNIIFSPGDHGRDYDIWRSWLNPYSPDGISTSGITQPPMLAEAIIRIGAKLPLAERRSWYKLVYPALTAYHKWLYKDRDPHDEGLVLLIHPWEAGLDNTPPWIAEMQRHQMPLWIRFIDKTRMTNLFNVFRRDIKFVPVNERLSTIDALSFYSVQRRLRRKNYNISRILNHGLFAIEDLTFNSILVRANYHLESIAKTLRYKIDDDLKRSMDKTEKALEDLWDQYSGQYYSRNFITHDLLRESSIAALMPLYAGTINRENADRLVSMLENKHLFGSAFPVPSAPFFNERCYWQGPTWINTNWLIIDGLERMGYKEHSEALCEVTVDLVNRGGSYEYFDPIKGEPAGSPNFSWTAALAIDLAYKMQQK